MELGKLLYIHLGLPADKAMLHVLEDITLYSKDSLEGLFIGDPGIATQQIIIMSPGRPNRLSI